MKTSEQIDRLIAEESAHWTEALRHGDRQTRAEFAKWSRKSPLHMRHFLMMVALDQELERMDPERRIALDPPAVHKSGNIVTFGERAGDSAAASPRARRLWAFAAVFICAVAAILAVPLFGDRADGWAEYTTARGEQRAVELPDGSVAHLNTSSRVLVRMLDGERQVRLASGEALFKVHHDTARPFRVYTSDAVIQAVGTQFNVYRQAAGTKVSVLEGKVRVSRDQREQSLSKAGSAAAESAAAKHPPAKVELLGAGEEVEVHNDGSISKTTTVDSGAIAAWRQRRLVFRQDSLSSVVTEFNRYNRTPQFRLVGTDVAARRYSGAFDADDPESLIALLAFDKDLRVERNGDEIIIRARNPAGTFAQSP